ncbi:MAG: fluoride efflux transporter CrcB [Gammaproteobacteria bacterium]|jgi:CrcB protein|nr:fluoride efflux transporter CrcB [Gammaproteobacteria bacterium]MDP6098216.1 fluoride efflux transporter CrcB [Gammaproteobacteria bacterium]|tara:strand:- start:2726 stop:3109 length:384 start_codon:yes stop_codon:yes gene_type:complete
MTVYYYIAIACGGAVGAVSRYWLATTMERFNQTNFPLGTFTVNLLGSFLIGMFFILFAEKIELAQQWRPIVIIGFLGAMTTFSTFSLDAILLMQQGNYNTAVFYLVTSVCVCLLAAWCGMLLARAVF